MAAARLGAIFRKDTGWILLIAGTGTFALLANIFGLFLDISTVLPHLFYLPVILAAYRFPRYGLLFAASLGTTYFLVLLAFADGDFLVLLSGGVRAVVFTIIGGVIAKLSVSLTEQKDRYRGLFDNAEAGAAVVTVDGNDFVIEEANYRLEQTLKAAGGGLEGQRLSLFWDDAAGRNAFAARVLTDGAGYSHEARWKRTDGAPVDVLVSAGRISAPASVITVIDITEKKNAETALKNANAEINVLSRLTRDDLMGRVDAAAGILAKVQQKNVSPHAAPLVTLLEAVIASIRRRLELAASLQDLGSHPPSWQPVQAILDAAIARHARGPVSIRVWTERLEIYADGHLPEVFSNLIDNAVRYGKDITEVVVTYHVLPDGLEIIVEDDGCGVMPDAKESIFEYDSMKHSGFGLFVDRQILGVTGISLSETGAYGSGGRFVLHVPQGRYRIL